MVLQSGSGTQKVRDELGSEPNVHEITRLKSDDVIVPGISFKSTQETIGDSWIVGSSTNGLVGTNTNTQGGGQQVVGGSGRVATVTDVVNTGNIHFETFNTTTFKDSADTTGDWDGASGDAEGTARVTASKILQSESVYKGKGTAIAAKMIVTMSVGLVSDINPYLSANGTASFEAVTNNDDHTFSTQGRDLHWKITGNSTADIARVKIEYTIL